MAEEKIKKCYYCKKPFISSKEEIAYCSALCRQKKVTYQKKYKQTLKYKSLKKEQDKQYRLNHAEEIKIRNLKYTNSHKDKIKKYQKEYSKKYLKNSEKKLIHYLRTRLNVVLKNNIKTSRSLILLGCSLEEFKIHIESQFKSGMTWENRGNGFNGKGMQEWHIDHIIPCSSFDFSNPEDQKKCFHYTNLQPLWATDNRIKHSKII